MSWAASKSIDDLLKRLHANDPTLTSLHIFQGKRFEEKEAAELAVALKGNSNLSELYASGHELSSSTIHSIAEAAASATSLRTLCLGNSSLGDAGAAAMAEGLSGNTILQQLDLENKSIGPKGCAAFGLALLQGLAISTLLLARNPFGNKGFEGLLKGLCSSKIASLDVRDCGITEAGSNLISEFVGTSKSLRILRLDENPLGGVGATTLATAITEGSSLEELGVSGCNIGDEGIAAFAKASVNSKLRSLEANNCSITARGTETLAEALSSGSSLVCLKLHDNQIGNEGADNLGKALAAGSSLQDLDLSDNKLGVGAAKLLQGSSQIKNLNLSHSDLGDEGAQVLSTMLTACVHTHLQELELSDCGIGQAGISRICHVLQGFAAPALEVLLLAGNPGVESENFVMEVDVLSTTRTDLDVVWKDHSGAPTAVDGGPPKSVTTQNWSDVPERDTES